MKKRLYNSPLTEVMVFATERLMSSDSISNIAPSDNFNGNSTPGSAPKRQTPVF